jgi:hypothetical protein
MLSDLYADPTLNPFLSMRGMKGMALVLYLITSVVFATLILSVLTPRYVQFVRWARRSESGNASAVSIWDDAARVWPTFAVFSLIILAAFTLVSPRLSVLGADLEIFSAPVIRYLAQALAFVFFFVAASEYSSFVTGKSRLGTLGLILFLFIALPWILFALFTIKMDASNAMYAAAMSPTYGLAISSGLLLKPLPAITPFSEESIYLSMAISYLGGGYFVMQTNKIVNRAKALANPNA